MSRFISLFLVAAAICGIAGPLTADDTPKTATITLEAGEGFSFPVVLDIDVGKKTARQIYLPAGKKTIELSPGTYSMEVRNWRFGFPSHAAYDHKDGAGKSKVYIRGTVDPKRLTLAAGDTLRISANQPYQPYNGRFFRISGVMCGMVMTRPYWYQDVAKKWEGSEAFPNTPFFMVDPDHGPEKVFDDLAATVLADWKKDDKKGDHRGKCHMTFFYALTEKDDVPPALRKISKDDLKEIMLAEWKKMTEENAYRTFQTDKGRRHVTLAEGLELAKDELKKWKAENTKKD